MRVLTTSVYTECAEASHLTDTESSIWWSCAAASIDYEYRDLVLDIHVYRHILSDSAYHELVKRLSWLNQWECIDKSLVQSHWSRWAFKLNSIKASQCFLLRCHCLKLWFKCSLTVTLPHRP